MGGMRDPLVDLAIKNKTPDMSGRLVKGYLQVLRIFARSMRTYIIGRADVEGIPGGERMTAKKSGVSIGI